MFAGGRGWVTPRASEDTVQETVPWSVESRSNQRIFDVKGIAFDRKVRRKGTKERVCGTWRCEQRAWMHGDAFRLQRDVDT